MPSLVPIRVFVGHSDDDQIKPTRGREYPLRTEAHRLLQDDLLLETRIVPLEQRGGDLREKVLSSIAESHYFLLILTPASIRRPWVNFEIGAASYSLGSRIASEQEMGDRRQRFFILMPSRGCPQPEFVRGLVSFLWKEGSRTRPLAENLDKKGHHLHLQWPPGVLRTDCVRSRLGSQLLADVFRGKLPSVRTTSGRMSGEEYERWLNAFASWSCGSFLAISRQPLLYWWQGDGLTYRRNLERLRVLSPRIHRLTIWNKILDALPPRKAWNGLPRTRVARTVGRPATHSYCCDLSFTLDMLIGFAHDCHDPIEEAAYAFHCAVKDLLPRRWQEMLIYNNKHVIKAAAVQSAAIRYELASFNDSEAQKLIDLFDLARRKSPRVGWATLRPSFRVPGAGRILRDFVLPLSRRHDERCPHGRTYAPPPIVSHLWSTL